jgi:IS1 family transposase
VGERWGCLIVDRPTRCVAAHATGPRVGGLAARAIDLAHRRSGGRPIAWCGDGWQPYADLIRRRYRVPVRTGRRGRPPLRVPPGGRLTQTITRRGARGRLTGVAVRATIGPPLAQPYPVHVERLNGVRRDRLTCLTRKTHAFAKTAVTWDALVGLAVFEQNWLRPHPALRQPIAAPDRRYRPRTPAMAIGLADHRWTWEEFFTTRLPITS